MVGLSLVHNEVNLSLGVAINKVGSCALLFENFEVISWYSSAEDREQNWSMSMNADIKYFFQGNSVKKYIFDERHLRFTYRISRYWNSGRQEWNASQKSKEGEEIAENQREETCKKGFHRLCEKAVSNTALLLIPSRHNYIQIANDKNQRPSGE